MAPQSISAVPQLGELLRYWRQERGKSQLDLSLDTGISQRHLSFVESWRSAPSLHFLSIVSDALKHRLHICSVQYLAHKQVEQTALVRVSLDAWRLSMDVRKKIWSFIN